MHPCESLQVAATSKIWVELTTGDIDQEEPVLDDVAVFALAVPFLVVHAIFRDRHVKMAQGVGFGSGSLVTPGLCAMDGIGGVYD